MAKCKWCKKSGWMLTVNRYGFCKDCDHEIREKIKGLLAQVQKTVTCTRQAPDRQMLEQLTPQIKQSLEIIRILEEMRPQVPFFRSSTAEYEKALTLGLERAAGKAPLPAAQARAVGTGKRRSRGLGSGNRRGPSCWTAPQNDGASDISTDSGGKSTVLFL